MEGALVRARKPAHMDTTGIEAKCEGQKKIGQKRGGKKKRNFSAKLNVGGKSRFSFKYIY